VWRERKEKPGRSENLGLQKGAVVNTTLIFNQIQMYMGKEWLHKHQLGA